MIGPTGFCLCGNGYEGTGSRTDFTLQTCQARKLVQLCNIVKSCEKISCFKYE